MQSVRDILLHTQNPIDLAQNRAFLYGESLFTTALVKNGNPIFFKEHCERTQKGLEMFFEHSFDKNELEEFLTKFVPKNYDGFFRPTFFMNKDKTKLYLEPILGELPDERINLKLKSIKRGKYEFDTKLKIGSYVQELFLKDKANSDGFDDIVYVYEDHLYDTSTANIFMIKGTEIITPKLEQRVLEGITRRKILEAIQVSERPIQYEELRDAKAVFLSSSLQGVIPVESVDGFEFDSVNHSLYKEVKAKLLSLMETYES